ncbi:DUF1565 domain-containing protein [Pseudanabaena mucicola]|uniref:DUF1565 domain-containing protein n=1 Tax=Pseudanabaena mucicola FACHB-723 TaxID=2692860 RepID=A0ABR7ZYN0_9CYAN|nr:DUF1565 domain-containing protein [Pseudanabaena mucicola]MBD2189116.1 DUF1565 domain-containing protein [Pseudanabaena mucicola FACHB-723]
MKLNYKLLTSSIFTKVAYLLPVVMLFPSIAISMPAFAQTSPNAKIIAQNTSQNTEIKILYVSSQTGSDRPDAGTNLAPFKTITYAISRAKAGQPTVIQLANGIYSTGEKFPIRLRPDIILRGNEANKGRDITILGGGTLFSNLRSTQNVAIVLSDRSELRGVTVTNPNPRGYGLWIENASPAIANNILLGNKQDGALITGKSTAILSANQFFRNGTSGLAIEGESTPIVRGNLFQQTIFGMSIRQDAKPQITENTFTQNQNGILIQANARPILRGNAIVNNRAYGLTISDLALPDLGTPNDYGNNNFQGNGTFDLQNVSRNAVAVIGNQVDSKKMKGNLQLSGIIANSDRFANINQQLQQRTSTSQTMNIAPNLATPPALVTATPLNPSSSISSNFSSNATAPSVQASSPFWYEPVTSVIIRINPNTRNNAIPINREITTNLPPILRTPPSGEPVNQPIQIAPLANTNLAPQAPPRYRVVVPVASPNAVDQVKRIVPNSFPSRLNGYLVVQTGAYSDRSVAEVQVSRLAQQGLSARIESINP